MKKTLVVIVLVFSNLLFVACQPSPEVIETSNDPIVESTPIVQETEVSDVLLMQEEARMFPQNQGVYDFSEGKLTIVKQYIPSSHQKDYLTISEIDLDPIKKDFEKTFPSKEWEGDPYMVYEDTFSPVSLSIDEEKIELIGEDFKKLFFFEDEDNHRVYDEHNIIYTIQYDK